jgi:hypothetical protein
MGDDFRIRIRLETALGFLQFFLQFLIILDDAVMHDGHLICCMRVRIALRRVAMRRPARVADADGAAERLFLQLVGKVDEFAFGAAAFDLAINQRGDARAVIAAVFKALEALHQLRGRFFFTENADDTAHAIFLPSFILSLRERRGPIA